jgi:hypothetical protein
MFIGHFALGLAAKRATPRVSLALLFAAAQLADILWPVFLAIGLERVRIDPGNTAFTPLDFSRPGSSACGSTPATRRSRRSISSVTRTHTRSCCWWCGARCSRFSRDPSRGALACLP